jgi:hypothetical protein
MNQTIGIGADPVNLEHLAIDIIHYVQATVGQTLHIGKSPLFVHVAEGLGIRSILHRDAASALVELT